MTEHSYFADRISAYHDGYLFGQELELIKRHLEECEECRRALADLEKLDRMVGEQSQLDGEEYWEKSAQRIQQRIAESSDEKVTDVRRSRFGSFSMRIAVVAASFLIIGYVALHESDILDDLFDAPPMDKPVMMAPSPLVPDSVVLESDVEPASKEASVELLDVELHEIKADLPADKQSLPEGKGAAEKKNVAYLKEPPPAAMVPDQIDDADDVVLQGIEPAAILPEALTPVALPPTDQAASSDLATQLAEPEIAEVATQLDEGELAETTTHLDEAISGRGEPDAIDFAPKLELQSMEVGRLGQSTDTTLTKWREIRDQNLAAYPQAAPDMTAAFNTNVAKSTASRQRSAADSDTVSSEELLLRAWYQIALNTDDPDERAAAVSFFEQYVKDENARFPALAGDYLKVLGELSE